MRQDRIMVTVSPQMRVALRLLAERSGLSEATQATVTLRQALDRTITSEAGQAAIRSARAGQTAREWRDGVMTDHYVEQLPYAPEVHADAPLSAPEQPAVATATTKGRRPRSSNGVAAPPRTPAEDHTGREPGGPEDARDGGY